jgi:glutaredoxin-related protein
MITELKLSAHEERKRKLYDKFYKKFYFGDDREIIFLMWDIYHYSLFSYSLMDNEKFIKTMAIKKLLHSKIRISDGLKNNKKFILEIIQILLSNKYHINAFIKYNVSSALKDDDIFAIQITNNKFGYYAYKYLSYRLKINRKIILKILENCKNNLKKYNLGRDFETEFGNVVNEFINEIPMKLFEEEDFVLSDVVLYFTPLNYISDKLRDNKKFIIKKMKSKYKS